MSRKKDSYRDLDNYIKIKADGFYQSNSEDEQQYLRFQENKLLAVLGVILLVSIFISIFLTVNLVYNHFSPARYFNEIRNNSVNFIKLLSGRKNANGINIIVCRCFIIILVGAALSVSGAVFQGVFRNPMASPGIIGAQSGGVLAGALYLFLFTADHKAAQIYSTQGLTDYIESLGLLECYARQAAILLGSLLTVIFVVSIARAAGRGKISSLTLLIVGSVLSTFIQSLISALRYYMVLLDPTDTRVSALQLFLMGSFNDTFSAEHLILIGVPVVICLLSLYWMRMKINVLVFGEEEAIAMGIRVGALRGVLIAIATIMTAITVSFCGQIGFIGMMVPHMARMISGPDYKRLIPVSALLGSICMLAIYDIAAMLNAAIYVNLFSSLIGGTFFMIIMIRSRRRRDAEWA
jgi:iron complex transport system permease protein